MTDEGTSYRVTFIPAGLADPQPYDYGDRDLAEEQYDRLARQLAVLRDKGEYPGAVTFAAGGRVIAFTNGRVAYGASR